MRELLEQIRDLSEELSRTKAQLDRLAIEARLAGCTWAGIGNALGMSKQAAQRRFSTLMNEPPPPGDDQIPGQAELPVAEPEEIRCPTCPVCGSQPLFAWATVVPWMCPSEDCNVFGWDPYGTLEQNLTDARPVRHFINGVEQPPAE